MVYQTNQETFGNESVMWDFRQVYVKWIDTSFINDFVMAQKLKAYPIMLDKIKDWHSMVWGRAISSFDEDLEKNNDKIFDSIIHKIITISNQYEKTFLGKERNPTAVNILDDTFKLSCTYLISLMKKHKMFGSESVNRSL